MINRELINPQSIVVVGGSNNVHKPGGRLVRNLLDGKYKGALYVVNAKEDDVQGLKSYHSVQDIPETELAIISIPGPSCPEVVDVLAKEKNVKAFIVISAGFGEETPEGAALEERMLESNRKRRLERTLLYLFHYDRRRMAAGKSGCDGQGCRCERQTCRYSGLDRNPSRRLGTGQTACIGIFC